MIFSGLFPGCRNCRRCSPHRLSSQACAEKTGLFANIFGEKTSFSFVDWPETSVYCGQSQGDKFNQRRKTNGETDETQTIAAVAEAADISKAQAKAALEAVAGDDNAKDGFTIPVWAKGAAANRPAKVMRFGPNEGKEIDVPAKTKLKFTFLKAAAEETG